MASWLTEVTAGARREGDSDWLRAHYANTGVVRHRSPVDEEVLVRPHPPTPITVD